MSKLIKLMDKLSDGVTKENILRIHNEDGDLHFLRDAILNDEEIEFQNVVGGEWHTASEDFTLNFHLRHIQYRIKLNTAICVNGVPLHIQPLQSMKLDQKFYVPNMVTGEVGIYYWCNGDTHKKLLELGVCYANVTGAELFLDKVGMRVV